MSGVTIWFGLATEGPPADLPASTRSGRDSGALCRLAMSAVISAMNNEQNKTAEI